MNTPSALKAGLFVLAGAIMISFAAIFARLTEMPPTTSGFYRMVFGCLAFATLLLLRPEMRTGLKDNWSGSFLIGALFAADIWFWHRAIEYIGPGLSTLMANLQVFVLTAVGVIWMRERVGWRFASGLALAVTGLWLLFGRDWANLPPDYRLGIVLGILTALAYGFYLLALRGFQIRHSHIRPEARLLQSTLCCGLVLGVANVLEGNNFVIPTWQAFWALVGMGVACQMLGWLLITRGMPFLPAALVGLLLLIQPSSSIVWDMIIFGLRLEPWQIVGIVLALVGIYLGMRSAARRKITDG